MTPHWQNAKWLLWVPVFSLYLAGLSSAFARGGGGCLEQGTAVRTPSGEAAVETLKPGDAVSVVRSDRLVAGSVAAVVRVEPDEYVEIVCGDRTLRATAEHPVQTSAGVFRGAGRLRPGDTVFARCGDGISPVTVTAVRRVPAHNPAYDLLVDAGGVFVAGDLVAHNKGCFVPDTPVLLAGGESKAISRLSEGDVVLAFNSTGALVRATVRSVISRTVDEVVVVKTDRRVLEVTSDHPFYTGQGTFKTLEALKVGDAIYETDGLQLVAQKISGMECRRGTFRVYNLQTDVPHTFFAAGFAVHNKGCFTPETLVRCGDGVERPIGEIQTGTKVLACDASGRMVQTEVRETHRRVADSLLAIRMESGRTIRVTPEHPFAVGFGEFREACSLRTGDPVLAVNGNGVPATERIAGVEREEGLFVVHNVRVDAPHTFVAGDLVVHNKGCFVPDTLVLLAGGGSKAISRLSEGDVVLAFNSTGALVRATVRSVISRTVDEIVVVKTDRRVVEVTSDHPFYTGQGTFKTLEALKVGDAIYETDGLQLVAQKISGMEYRRGTFRVYNLQTDVPHTFFAAGFAVHNKGCFTPETLVRCGDGVERPIGEIRTGTKVLAYDASGRMVQTEVRETYRRVADSLLAIRLESGRVIRVTPEHPFAVGFGEFREACSLRTGDPVLAVNGNGVPATERIAGVEREEGLFVVHNVRVDAPHTFVAGGCVVHNKGGYSGGHGSGGSGSSDPTSAIVFISILGAAVVIWIIVNRSKARSEEDLDYVYPRSAIDRKAKKTLALLEFIARTDPEFAPKKLAEHARTVFVKLQECWQARDYAPMKPLMMPDLYENHLRQINGMIRNHEINKMEDMKILSVDLVNVRYTHKENQREFTASFIARMRDTYVDDRTGDVVRGDRKPATFQEFWTFHRQGKAWFLRDIEQSRETDVLKDENFFEQFTDQGVAQVYGDAEGKEGPAGPWSDGETVFKVLRVERLLNFLVETDKVWDRQAMLTRAREVFTNVYMAAEAGDPAAMSDADLFPGVAGSLRADVAVKKKNGVTSEFRNFCVRRVELVHIGNYADPSKDEFTARISAHAQWIIRKGDTMLRRDDDVAPFVEYWTFGRAAGGWKLKEIVPDARGEDLIQSENVDEDSSADRLQWYYKQTRAV